ncbi:Serine protease 56 [Porphyridium purpureum]|uniref:Serine protease 56 n=1 Tax=Porphyridium purpureum TaxID=35688 RepID=A0A5J4Z6M3_PORPP|nr:Serine protease 56 [Porphyridium purpureum]|eukprot:POR9495..scf295_1
MRPSGPASYFSTAEELGSAVIIPTKSPRYLRWLCLYPWPYVKAIWPSIRTGPRGTHPQASHHAIPLPIVDTDVAKRSPGALAPLTGSNGSTGFTLTTYTANPRLQATATGGDSRTVYVSEGGRRRNISLVRAARFVTHKHWGTPHLRVSISISLCMSTSMSVSMSISISKRARTRAQRSLSTACKSMIPRPHAPLVVLMLVLLTLCLGPLNGVCSAAELTQSSKVSVAPRIVNGQVAELGEYPWFAHIRMGGLVCGGMLVSSTFAVTAAHCIPSNANRFLNVEVFYNSTDALRGPKAEGAMIYVHPEYDEVTRRFDVAIIRLVEPVDLPAYPRLFGLDAQRSNIQGRVTTTIGFGALRFGGPIADTLMKTEIYVQRAAVCNNLFIGTFDSETMICAGFEPGPPTDSCQGDSGGPLMLGNSTVESIENPVIVGIVSFGVGCASLQYPAAAYSRVSAFSRFLGCVMGRDGFGGCADEFPPRLQLVAADSPQSSAPSPEPSATDDSGIRDSEPNAACFPAFASVELVDGSRKRMDQVILGDVVRVSATEFSPVVFWGHRDPSRVHNDFVRIKVEDTSEAVLVVSADHLVYANNALILARAVNTDDFVMTASGEWKRVAQVERRVRGRGLFNPHTAKGDIVVDGYVTSCYTEWLHAVTGHAMLAFARLLWRTCGLDLTIGVMELNSVPRALLHVARILHFSA